VCFLSLMFLRSGSRLAMRESIFGGCLLILLPLSGGNGLLYIPGIAAWMLIRPRCVSAIEMATPEVQKQSFSGGQCRLCEKVLLVSAFLSSLIGVGYFLGYKAIEHPWRTPGKLGLIVGTVRVFTAGFGQLVDKLWPLSGFATLVLVAASLTRVLFLAVDRRCLGSVRIRAADLAAFMVSFMPLALAVAYGRGGRSTPETMHYSTLAVPIIYWCIAGWFIGESSLLSKSVQVAFVAVVSLLSVRYLSNAIHNQRYVNVRAAEIEQELRGGVTAKAVVDKHMSDLFYINDADDRKLVKDGIDDLRKGSFTRYGAIPTPK
jgi:hypothetical protein